MGSSLYMYLHYLHHLHPHLVGEDGAKIVATHVSHKTEPFSNALIQPAVLNSSVGVARCVSDIFNLGHPIHLEKFGIKTKKTGPGGDTPHFFYTLAFSSNLLENI